MMGKRSLSRTWCLVVIGLVPVGLALSITGCGGGGPGPGDSRTPPRSGGNGEPTSPDDGLPPADPELLVRLTVAGHFGIGAWRLEVDRDGACEAQRWEAGAGKPVGFFGTLLTAAETRELAAAVRQTRRQASQDRYPGPPTGPGGLRGWLELPVGGALRTIEFSGSPGYIPEAVEPLYGGDSGLLVDLLRRSLRHPSHAVALAASTDRARYRRGDSITLTLAVRSVGSGTAAFASIESRDIVHGRVDVWGYTRTRRIVVAEQFSFGTTRLGWALPELTARARRDLVRVEILAPGEEYTFPFPTPLRAQTPGALDLIVHVVVYPNYDLAALDQALGARFVGGWLTDVVRVRVIE